MTAGAAELSCRADRVGLSPRPSALAGAAPKAGPPIELRDIHDRFAALTMEPEPVRTVRGVGLAVAQEWLITLPAGPAKDKAINALGDAVDLAAEACTTAA